MFTEVGKSFYRRIRNIEYNNIDTIQGYSEIESNYIVIRDSLCMLKDCLKSYKTLEYGNPVFKNLIDFLEYINNKAKLNIYKKKSVFQYISDVGQNIEDKEIEKKEINFKEENSIAKNFFFAYREINKSKNSFNIKIKELLNDIDNLLLRTLSIDELRKKVKNQRYDLELLSRNKNVHKEILNVEKKTYLNDSKESFRSINKFLLNSNIEEIFLSFLEIHKKYLLECEKHLSFIK